MHRLLRLLADGFRRIGSGASYITLDPSPRLRALRLRQEARVTPMGPLPPLPESACTAGGALLEPQWWPPRSGGTPR
jgi:hypothetical protein